MAPLYETLETSRSDHVLEILINRPDQRNAINHQLHHELTDAFAIAAKDPDVRAVVLGAHGRFFSAGGDFALMLEGRKTPERRPQMEQDARDLFEAVCLCPCPVVIALQGDAIGLGATIALGGDAIVAARSAMLSDPHVVIGLVAGDGGCVLWPAATGLLRAKRYLLTGDRLSAEDAHAMGLISDLVDDPAKVLEAARALAARIARHPPLATRLTKQALNHGLKSRMDEVFEAALEAEMTTFFSQDVGEAIAAFREKREGQYRGL